MFFQVDDKLHANPKVNAMLDELGLGKAGPALALWTLAGSRARDAGYDGVLTTALLGRLVGDRRVALRAAAVLVRFGLWHEPGHDCPRCPPVEEGTFLFHDWFQFGYGTAAAEKVAVAKRKELRTPGVVEAVWARDTGPDGKPRCRYCAREVVRPKHGGNRKTATIGQLDHVDPTLADGPRNIVVACPDCNRTKGQRTPEQAGMSLLPAPTPTVQVHGSSHGGVPPAGARAGTGVAGVGPGSGTGEVRQGRGSGERPTEVGRAGEPPPTEVPARFGSPWRDHSGPPPPPELIDQATCPDHGHPTPCRTCAAETYRPEGTR